jgi:group I intron endonuclease
MRKLEHTARSGIYAITHLPTGMVYVGSAVKIGHRWWEHKKHLRRGSHGNGRLQGYWNKHGESEFAFSVLEFVADRGRLIEREQFYIDTLNPWFNIKPKAGSNLGFRFTAEQRAKLSAAQRGNQSAKGWKPSEETRALWRSQRRGVRRKPELERRIKLSRQEWMAKCALEREARIKERKRVADERKRSPEYQEAMRTRLSRASLARVWTAEQRAAHSELTKRQWEKRRAATGD